MESAAMKRLDNRFLLGGLLVLGGVIFLLQNLGVLILNNLIWGIVLAIAGLSFIYVTISDRRSWWAIIPGIILLYTGLLVFLDYFAPESVGRIGGELFLGAIGLSFLVVYLLNRSNWWAIIPAGVLFTLSATAVASNYFAGMQTGGLFFLGLGISRSPF
jgi:hypothetical protein